MRELLNKDNTYCLRGIAMLMIIISHTFNGYPIDNETCYYPTWMNWLHMELWGGMGVAIFLFISGYGLFHSLSRKESINRQYIVAKVERLLVPFVIYWIVEIIVLFLFDLQELTPHIFYEIATISIHPDIENWFFKVIVVIYIVMLILFRCRISNGTRISVVFLLSVVYLFAMKELGVGQWWWNNILCFPLGAFVAHKRDWFTGIPSYLITLFTGGVIIALVCIHINTIVLHLNFVVFCIYAVRIVNIENKVLGYIGFNSFIFYFIECPVMDEVMMFSYSCFPLYSFLSVVGTFAISYLCINIENRMKHRIMEH